MENLRDRLVNLRALSLLKNTACIVICECRAIYHRFDALRRPILRVYARSRGQPCRNLPELAKAQLSTYPPPPVALTQAYPWPAGAGYLSTSSSPLGTTSTPNTRTPRRSPIPFDPRTALAWPCVTLLYRNVNKDPLH